MTQDRETKMLMQSRSQETKDSARTGDKGSTGPVGVTCRIAIALALSWISHQELPLPKKRCNIPLNIIGYSAAL